MHAAQKNTLVVQSEVTIHHAKIPEAAAQRGLVIRSAILRAQLQRQSIKIRFLNVPQLRILNPDFSFNGRIAARKVVLRSCNI